MFSLLWYYSVECAKPKYVSRTNFRGNEGPSYVDGPSFSLMEKIYQGPPHVDGKNAFMIVHYNVS